VCVYTGRSPGHAVGMDGCGHSKIARVARVVFVFVLYVAVLPSLQFLTVTKTVTKCCLSRSESLAVTKSGCHEVMSRGLTSHSTLFTCTPANELRSPGCAQSLGFLMGYLHLISKNTETGMSVNPCIILNSAMRSAL